MGLFLVEGLVVTYRLSSSSDECGKTRLEARTATTRYLNKPLTYTSRVFLALCRVLKRLLTCKIGERRRCYPPWGRCLALLGPTPLSTASLATTVYALLCGYLSLSTTASSPNPDLCPCTPDQACSLPPSETFDSWRPSTYREPYSLVRIDRVKKSPLSMACADHTPRMTTHPYTQGLLLLL